MSKERFTERQANANNSVRRLLEAAVLQKSEIVRDAVIQRFEFSYEAVWKALQIYLEHQGHECPGSRSVVRKAFAERFISTAEEADLWFQMIVDRNLTSQPTMRNSPSASTPTFYQNTQHCWNRPRKDYKTWNGIKHGFWLEK